MNAPPVSLLVLVVLPVVPPVVVLVPPLEVLLLVLPSSVVPPLEVLLVPPLLEDGAPSLGESSRAARRKQPTKSIATAPHKATRHPNMVLGYLSSSVAGRERPVRSRPETGSASQSL